VRTQWLKRTAFAALATPVLALTIATGAAAAPTDPAAVDLMAFVHAPPDFAEDTPGEVVYELASVGDGATLGARLMAPLPADVRFDRFTRTEDWNCDASTAVLLNCTLTNETTAALLGIQLIPRDGPNRTVTLIATVSGPAPDPNRRNNTASEDVPIHGAATVTGRVWHDQDRDGRQDEPEPGIGAHRVALYDVAGQRPALRDSRLTDAGGKYRFTGVRLGRYRVVVQAPDATWTFTVPDAGDDEAIDSDVRVVTDGALARPAAAAPGPIAQSGVLVLDGRAPTVIDAGLLKKAASPSPTATPTAAPTESPTASPSPSVSPSGPAPTPSPTAPGDGGGPLPSTGVALTGLIAVSMLLLGVGALLVLIARRRQTA
jgi:hypothetical protein